MLGKLIYICVCVCVWWGESGLECLQFTVKYLDTEVYRDENRRPGQVRKGQV